MTDYRQVDYDNGGVHINSGIPNHAFYVTAREIGGQAWEKAGLIWYRTLSSGALSAEASFQDAANLTFRVAGEEFGEGSREQQAVRTGWTEVGLTPQVTAEEEKEKERDRRPGCGLGLAGLFVGFGRR